jgi:hypothetical protein
VRVREHTKTPSKKGIRRRRDILVQIFEIWPVCLQASDWSPKHAWIGCNFGMLVSYFESFELVSWFLDLSLIRLKRIYNFRCSMLVYALFVLCFVTLRDVFMHFPKLTY